LAVIQDCEHLFVFGVRHFVGQRGRRFQLVEHRGDGRRLFGGQGQFDIAGQQFDFPDQSG
jgi:hypothetical protein